MKNTGLTTTTFWDEDSRQTVKCYPNPKLCRVDKELMVRLHPFLESKRWGELCEMGCGCSYMLPWFADEYWLRVYGVDFSLKRLEAASENLKANLVRGELLWSDFDRLPTTWEGKFDVVYSGGVVEHFCHPADTLRRFAGCLRSDGVMITTAPHLKGFWGELGRRLDPEADRGYVRMDLADLVREHREAGLEVVHATYFRWLDFSVVNYALLPSFVRKVIYGTITLLNIVLSIVLAQRSYRWLPCALYSDMLVVARNRKGAGDVFQTCIR